LRFDIDRVASGAVFFLDARLSRCDTGGGVVGDPGVAPVVWSRPLIRRQIIQ
jgi:hypothetical protein